ncbi:OsmC family peroxiredoxin [Hymenobacter yonginensis]|uniref:OsmC family peroxiredoxin n=1 Tax=Hymenobacter yonginensis TaxID=748197 RepID=A0ABY7PV49_9BACT|nr:OsmC family peroxiredoxin [Hymenobacter yonginensis]WBO86525.1 OsmC family peroxiredoxin [Hymenobacter yonginensis]
MSIIQRSAAAQWHGRGTDGTGQLSTGSTVLQEARYSYRSRFAEGGVGTNPEELLAAAHAGCFAMKLAFNLQSAGFTADHIHAQCAVALHEGCIVSSHLTVDAAVPGLSAEQFERFVNDASQNCPVSKVLQATITYQAILA